MEWPREIGANELEELAAVVREIETLPHVTEVISLSTARVVERLDSGLKVRDFASLAPGVPALESVRRHPLLHGTLLSRDGRSAPLLVLSDLENGDPRRMDLLEAIEGLLPRIVSPDVTVRLLGGDVVQRTMTRYILRDMIQNLALEALFFLILLPILFRSVRGMAIPLLAVNSAVLLNFGLMVVLGQSITSLGVAIPGLIIIIALCDAIHMMHRFEEALHKTHDKSRAIVEMMSNVGQACFFTSFTTGLGFLSLMIARHAAVRQFALSATFGVAIAFFAVITILPLALAFWPVRGARPGGLKAARGLSYGRVPLTLALFTLGLILSALGIQRIVIDADWIGELPERDPVVADLRWYEEHFNGLLRLEAKLDGDLATPQAFAAVDRLQQVMVAEAGISGAESYVDWVREMAGNPESIGERQIREAIGFMRLAGADFPRHIVTEDLKQGRIIFQTRDVGIKRYLELEKRLEAEAAQLPEGLKIEAAGYSRMAYSSSKMVVTTLLSSLALSLVSISLFVMLSFRSVRLGLISVIPNFFPIVVALGVTGWLNIPLRIGIVMIYCLGIGLAVDDSIHLITRFIQERRIRPDLSNRDLLLRTLRTTGKALITTSAVLGLGALSYLPSSFKSIADVGTLLTVIVVAALVTDLFLLPILIEKFLPQSSKL